MSPTEQLIVTAVKAGLTVSQIETTYGIPNRAVRKIKKRLYSLGILVPTTTAQVASVKHDTIS